MPDIESVIYKLELDSSGYIRGVDAAASSLTRLNEVQTDAKKRLDTNEAALKANADRVTQANKALESYTGTNDRYRKQLEKDIKSAQADQAKLIDLVKKTADEYDQATKAAQGFAGVSQKATQVQQDTTGGKIPVAPPVVQPPIVQEIQAQVDTTGLDELPAILAQSNDEFEQLRASIALTEEAMKGLNAEDEDFKSLASIVASGKDVLAQFDQAAGTASDSAGDLKKEVKQGGDEIRKFATSTDQAGDAVLSLKGQIRAGKEELVKLEAAGKSASKEYQQLELRVAELTDAFGDQQNRIKVLASDTRALDFGKAAITSALGAFQAYTSAAILLGAENEDLTKKTQQLFAAMQLLTSLEQLMAQVQRGGVLITNAQAAAQAAYTAVVGASTGALRVFRLALAATGIGAAVIAIVLLVQKMQSLREATSKADENQRRYNQALKEAGGEYENAVKQVNELRINIDLAKQGFLNKDDVVKRYNETIGKTTGEVKSLDEAEQALNKNANAYIQFTLLKAAANISLGEAAKKAFEAELQSRKSSEEFASGLDKAGKAINENKFLGSIGSASTQKDAEENNKREIAAANKRSDDRKAAAVKKTQEEGKAFQDIATDLQKKAAELAKQFGFDFFGGGDKKKAEQDFADDLARIQADITKANFEALKLRRQRELEALSAIIDDEKRSYAERLTAIGEFNQKSRQLIELNRQFEVAANQKTIAEEKRQINKRLNDTDNKLTVKQRQDLNTELSLLSTKQAANEKLIREKSIDDINKLDKVSEKQRADLSKKLIDTRARLEDELTSLQGKTIEQRLNLIQDEFERRAKLIDFYENQELENAREATAKRLASLDQDRSLIGEEEFQKAKAQIITNGEQAALNILQKFAQQRKDLAADAFKDILDSYQEAIRIGDLVRDEGVAKLIRNVSDRFLSGKISFEKFQRELTKIQKDNEAIRRDATLATQKNELAAIEKQLAGITDTGSKEFSDLVKTAENLRSKIAQGETADATADAEDANTDATKKIERFVEYTRVIGELAESVISFWAKANEAERNALDRSIALQEKRVEAAQRIAERGNAQYLKAEEDRLKELQVKRENAARRELGINAALQASQLLVGITGAIAKIATPGIGIAETIGAIATIFAALATGYGLVKSLQGNQPKLAEGTTYVKRGKNPPGKDTIPAWINEGEAIIPTERNKNYKKAVEAIYHEKVPAHEMNRFVENYTGNKTSTQSTVYDTTNQNLSTYKSFVTNISKVPAPVLNSFIENYQKAQYFKGTTDLKRTIEPQGRDTIPVMAHEGEAIIPTFINKLYQPTIKAVYDQKIPADRINSFVKEFHQIKPVPLVHYEKIRESAEMKIHQDGRLAGLLSEQNKMLAENNDLQRTTIRALKSMGVNVNVDRNGLALSVMEAVEQIKIDSRT